MMILFYLNIYLYYLYVVCILLSVIIQRLITTNNLILSCHNVLNEWGHEASHTSIKIQIFYLHLFLYEISRDKSIFFVNGNSLFYYIVYECKANYMN